MQRMLVTIITIMKTHSIVLSVGYSGIVTPGLTRARAVHGNHRWLFELNLSV